ncbi:IMPG2 protein, partial [Turnix velox]|nr:IMPG2 protein [Turnix velox]
QGSHSSPHPSLSFLGAGRHEGPVGSTAQPAMATDPASLLDRGKGSSLPVPTITPDTPEVTSTSLAGALDLTTWALRPHDKEGPSEHSHVPMDQTWHPPAVSGPSPTPVAPDSSAVTQSRVSYTSPGSPSVSPPPQPAPVGGSAVPPLPVLQPSPGTGWGVLALGPTVGTPQGGPSPRVQLPHSGSGVDSAESLQITGETTVGVGDPGSWVVTAQPSWQPDSLVPLSTSGSPQQPPLSQSVSSLEPTTTASVTASTVTTTITATTASPALLRGMGTVTPEPGAAVLESDMTGLLWGSTRMPGPPQQPTDPPGTLDHHGDPESPPAATATDLVQPSSSPGGWQDADTLQGTLSTAGRAPQVFIVEDQPPLLRASLLRIPCELVLDMVFDPVLQDPGSRQHQELLQSFNRTVSVGPGCAVSWGRTSHMVLSILPAQVTPLFMSVPGFLWLEVTGIREGSVVLEYEALLAAERVPAAGLGELLEAALGPGAEGLAVGSAPVIRNVARGQPLDPCAELFACRAGFACVAGAEGNATCTSLCHRGYCKNQGICTHPRDRGPLCQCPVGSDFWFMGLRCDYRVTQQSLLGAAAGVLLSILLLAAVLAAVAIRRFKVLLMEAR